MILVCEVMFDRSAHVPFNAGLLATISAAFPKENLAFWGAAAHLEQLKKQVGQALAESILWNEITPIPPGPNYGERFLRELKLIHCLLGKLPECSTSRLILTSAFPSTVLAMKVARLFTSKRPMVQMVLHGLSGVVGPRRRHPLHRMQDMNTALNLMGNRGIQYLVLEEPIRDMVVACHPHFVGKIESLDHPISPAEGTIEILNLDEPIRIGFLGTALKSKGYPLFVDVANAITEKYGRRVEFHVIGRCPEESKCVKGGQVLTTQPASGQLTREDFVRGIALLHFVVLPYEAASYSLTASGVLLDAIAWQKPVIARRIPAFEAMFRKYGDIGYLFDTDMELVSTIERILMEKDKMRYGHQTLVLRKVRKARDPESLASAYRELCKKSEET